MKVGIAIVLTCMVIGANEPPTYGSVASPATGYLSITTNPSEAAVYLDDAHVGVSPVQLLIIPAGKHRVRIVKSGYLDSARIVTVVAGASRAIQVKLTRASDASGL
jgi:PEGA domain